MSDARRSQRGAGRRGRLGKAAPPGAAQAHTGRGSRAEAARPAPPRALRAPSPHGRRARDGQERRGRVTCEAGEARDALGDRELLEVGGQLHLHDAGHAVQNHPAARVRCPPPAARLAAALA